MATFSLSAGTAAILALAAPSAVLAQSAEPLQRITVTGSRTSQGISVSGFGDVPLRELPLSATVITRAQLADAGIGSLGDITRLEADITDAYNAPGYINQLAVRGFTLDNRFNVRRDGLPVNAETVIHPANKQALEVLKGTSGLQAGTSAPGGLLNLVVKRPTGRVREATFGWTQRGTAEAAVDLGDRVDLGGHAAGWRINLAGSRLDPQTRDSRGERHLAAAAGEVQIGGLRIEAEVETSRQSQPSVPGFSLLGLGLPDATSIDPRTNLNNQAWTLPVVFRGDTASLRLGGAIGERVAWSVHGMRQRLRNDDRIAFPYGCSAENAFDRYCSNGSFDFYDFRSENERRTSDALQASLQGRHTVAGMEHQWRAGVLRSRYVATLQPQAFNAVGEGRIDGQSLVAPDPSLTDQNTHRDESSTEAFVQDAIRLDPRWQLWLGARHTQLDRRSVRTDGSRATAYRQSFTTPWLGVSVRLAGESGGRGPSTHAYASWGKGIESEVAPNRRRYVNAGEALPALQSRQLEVGLKHRRAPWDARVALFDIRRPAWDDFHADDGALSAGDCSDADPCRRQVDGAARHRGVEAELEWQGEQLSVRASAMALQARREDSAVAGRNGLRPTNVPARSLKLQGAWNVPAVPGLALMAFVTHEGQRMVLPDNSTRTPGWTRLDIGARYSGTLQNQRWVLRAGVDNLANRRAWQEAPYQFDHAYLYPLAPRTLRLSAQTRF